MGTDARNSLKENCGTLLQTMYTLWKAITGGTDWENVGDPLFEVSPVVGITFILYIAFAVCALLNVVTGVFVNKALKLAEGDQDLMLIEHNKSRKEHTAAVKAVFDKADVDGNGCLSREEFAQHFDDPCVRAFFVSLDLDFDSVDPEQLFDLLDFDGNQMIEHEEFIYGCSVMKGVARNLDLARVSLIQNRQGDDMMQMFRRMLDAQTQQGRLFAALYHELGKAAQLSEACAHAYAPPSDRMPKLPQQDEIRPRGQRDEVKDTASKGSNDGSQVPLLQLPCVPLMAEMHEEHNNLTPSALPPFVGSGDIRGDSLQQPPCIQLRPSAVAPVREELSTPPALGIQEHTCTLPNDQLQSCMELVQPIVQEVVVLRAELRAEHELRAALSGQMEALQVNNNKMIEWFNRVKLRHQQKVHHAAKTTDARRADDDQVVAKAVSEELEGA